MSASQFIHGVTKLGLGNIEEQGPGVFVRKLMVHGNSYDGSVDLTLFASSKEALQVEVSKKEII